MTCQQALQTASLNAKQWQSFVFLQDDFKVTPTLTVNTLGAANRCRLESRAIRRADGSVVWRRRWPGPWRIRDCLRHPVLQPAQGCTVGYKFCALSSNLGRNILRAPVLDNWDLSVSKRVRLFSTQAFPIRAGFLNAFDQDNYSIPINSLNNIAFGTNTNNRGNRSVTLSAKYTF